MTDQEAKDAIERLAYFKWQAAGSPVGCDAWRYWREAEYEVMNHTYADVKIEEVSQDL